MFGVEQELPQNNGEEGNVQDENGKEATGLAASGMAGARGDDALPKGEEAEIDPTSFTVIQNRFAQKVNEETVADYVESLNVGLQLPRVKVYKDEANKEMYSPDGAHRQEAFRRLKKPIPVIIFLIPNAKRLALKDSLKANHDNNALRRSNKDKRRQVEVALLDSEWGKLNDSEIARLTLTSHPFVAKLRRELRADESKPRVNPIPVDDEEQPKKQLEEIADDPPSAEHVLREPSPMESREPIGQEAENATNNSHVEPTLIALGRILDTLHELPRENGWSVDGEAMGVLNQIAQEITRIRQLIPVMDKYDIFSFRQFCEDRQITHAQVAIVLGVSRPVVSRWLKEVQSVPKDRAVKLEEIMAMGEEELRAIFDRPVS